MRLVTTAALGAAALVLAVAIQRVDRKPLAGKRAAALANVLVRFDPAAVNRIEVERGVSKTVMESRQGAWFFTAPEQDRVDATLAIAVLDRLNHLGIVDDLEEGGERPDPVALGLEGDRAVRITLSGGEGGASFRESLVLGLEAPRTGSIYARREGGEPGTFVVDGNPRPWMENPLETMRDRRILGAPVGALTQLVIRQASGEVALQRRIVPPVQDWALVSPITSWADREAMDRLLTALASLQIEEVVRDAGPTGEIPNPLPQDAVVFQAAVHEVARPLTIYLRRVGDAADGRPLLEARVSDRPAVYRLASDFLTNLPKTPNDLRDRRLARIPAEFLDAIRIQSRVDPLVDLRAEAGPTGVSWKVVLGNKLVPANQSEVNQLVGAVNEAAIRDFVSDDAADLAGFGLKTPHRRLHFTLKFPGEPGPDGSPGAPRELTRVLNLGWPGDEAQRLFANFEGEAHVYELDPTFLNAIPTHPVKWKSLNVITFNPMHLVSITRETPDEENLKLTYHYREDRWEATRSGLDVTASLDILSARRLRDRLGSLTASGWVLSLGSAYEALENPSLEFQIVTRELDRAVGEGRETTRHLRFAPSVGDLYFGQVVGSPEVFFVDRETYGDLKRHVTTARLPAP